MRVLKHISGSLLGLALVASSAAQMRNPPPASIYSVGGTTLGGPPASIYSLPSQPVTLGRSCCNIGVNIGSNRHQGHRPQHGGVVGYPVYYPVYPYYGYAIVEPPSESLPGAGTFDRPRAAEEPEPAKAATSESRRVPERADRDDSRYGEHYLDSRESRQAPPAPPPSEPSETVATVLIFHDGHRLEVRNYAIMGKTLWVLSPERQKILLEELDLEATSRENDDRGVDFRVPSAAE